MDADCPLVLAVELEELIEILLDRLSENTSLLDVAERVYHALKSLFAGKVPVLFLSRLPRSRVGRSFSCQLAGCILFDVLPPPAWLKTGMEPASEPSERASRVYGSLSALFDATLIRPDNIKGGYFAIENRDLYHLYLLVYLSQFIVLSLQPFDVSALGWPISLSFSPVCLSA